MGGRYIVGITGASGSLYAEAVIRRLLKAGCEVHLCLTRAGQIVVREELPWQWPEGAAPEEIQAVLRSQFQCGEELRYYDIHAIGAHGASHNLLERAADVVLKERGKLVLAVRETPFSTIHLQNMLTLSQCGAVIMPACPSFYHAPSSLEELADFFAGRLLDQLGRSDDSIRRWEGID